MHAFLIVGGTITTRHEKIVQLINQLQSNVLDSHFLEKIESSIGIKHIRSFINSLQLKPIYSTRCIGIIEDGEAITPDAQQAMLKTLEEPPGNSAIIIAAESPSTFLPTILSRCQIIILQAVEEHIDPLISTKLSTLATATPGEKISIINGIGKTKEDYLHFINQAIRINGTQNAKLAHALLAVKKYAQNNINITLLLENAFM